MENSVVNNEEAQQPMPGSQPFIHNVDSAPAYWWINDLWVVLAQAKDTGGRFSMMEELCPKGSGPGPHKHTWSDETFYGYEKRQSETLSKTVAEKLLVEKVK